MDLGSVPMAGVRRNTRSLCNASFADYTRTFAQITETMERTLAQNIALHANIRAAGIAEQSMKEYELCDSTIPTFVEASTLSVGTATKKHAKWPPTCEYPSCYHCGTKYKGERAMQINNPQIRGNTYSKRWYCQAPGCTTAFARI